MLGCADWEESHEGDLHGAEQTDDEEDSVGRVESFAEPSHEEKDECVQGDQVDDEHIASPSRHLGNI